MPDPVTEGISLEALKEGDLDAFNNLVLSQQKRVINICYRFLSSREDAEDVAQEVFMEAHRSLATFRGDASLSTWLYRIAVTRSLDLIRERKRKKRFAIIRDLFELKEAGYEPPAPASADPALHVIENEQTRVLADIVSTLPDKQKSAIVLTKYEGLSGQEAAEVMKISLSAVEALIHRALKTIREKLTFHYGGTP